MDFGSSGSDTWQPLFMTVDILIVIYYSLPLRPLRPREAFILAGLQLLRGPRTPPERKWKRCGYRLGTFRGEYLIL